MNNTLNIRPEDTSFLCLNLVSWLSMDLPGTDWGDEVREHRSCLEFEDAFVVEGRVVGDLVDCLGERCVIL